MGVPRTPSCRLTWFGAVLLRGDIGVDELLLDLLRALLEELHQLLEPVVDDGAVLAGRGGCSILATVGVAPPLSGFSWLRVAHFPSLGPGASQSMKGGVAVLLPSDSLRPTMASPRRELNLETAPWGHTSKVGTAQLRAHMRKATVPPV